MIKTSSFLISIIFSIPFLQASEPDNGERLINFYLKIKQSKQLLKNNQTKQMQQTLENILQEVILEESQSATQIKRLIEQSNEICKQIQCRCNQDNLSVLINQLEEKEMELDALCEQINQEIKKIPKSNKNALSLLKPYACSATAIFAYIYLNYKYDFNFKLNNSFYSNLKPAGVITGIIFILSQIWEKITSYISKPTSKEIELKERLENQQQNLLTIYESHKDIFKHKENIHTSLKIILELLNKPVTSFVVEKIKKLKDLDGRSQIFKDLELTPKPEQLLLKYLSEN